MERLPAGWLEEIVEMRAFARARQAYQRAQHWPDGPEKRDVLADPLVQLVMAIEFAAVPRG